VITSVTASYHLKGTNIMLLIQKYPAIRLENKLVVVNFTSPHPYTFNTGEVLPACSDEVAQEMKLSELHLDEKNKGGWIDVEINYCITEPIMDDLINLVAFDITDVVLVPYPVLEALKSYETDDPDEKAIKKEIDFVLTKTRTCRLDDRVTKVIKSDEFCK